MDNPAVVAAAKARWGLDRSLPEQYLIYVGNLLTGDLGTSFRTKQPRRVRICMQRLPATLELVDRGDAGRQPGRHHARRARRTLSRPGGSITPRGCSRSSARRCRSSGRA